MSDPQLELQVAWQQHVSSELSPFHGLMSRHRERHRRYHTATHVVRVIRHVHELVADEEVADVDAVVAAALYHDAIYEPRSPANERASARLARRDLTELGWSAQRVDAVGDMIERTAHHTDPPDVDTAVLFDADLAVLAADPAAYDEYVANVRAEYHHLDDDEWRTGRRGVLDGLLARDVIFATRGGRARWEEHARSNLTAELAGLA